MKIPRLALLAGALAAAGRAAEPAKTLTRDQAMARAEAIVAEQGYTAAAASAATLARDPFDPAGGRDAILAARQGSLEPKAAGARLDSGMWFVGFKTAQGGRIRGVMLDEKGELVRIVSQNIQLDWLNSAPPPEVKPLTAEEAAPIAVAFVKAQKRKGVAAKSAQVVENKGDTDRDRWESWWVYFSVAAKPKKGAKPAPAWAIVAVHKINAEAKWVPDAKP